MFIPISWKNNEWISNEDTQIISNSLFLSSSVKIKYYIFKITHDIGCVFQAKVKIFWGDFLIKW